MRLGRGLGREVPVKHAGLVRVSLLRGLHDIAHRGGSTYHAPNRVQVNSSVWEVRVHAYEVIVGLLRCAEVRVVHGVIIRRLPVLTVRYEAPRYLGLLSTD
jgi:hypothetical protein